jgi:DNA polymerase-3 subunit delta'
MQFSEILGQEHIKSHLTKVPIWVGFRMHNCLLVLKEAVRYPWRSLCAIHSMWQSKRENNGANQSCTLKFQKISHDLHFVYPTVTTEEVKKTQKIDFITDWRQFIIKALWWFV